MNSTNPRFILRNHLAQDSIEHAERDDFERARIFLKILENPFSNESIENILIDFKSSECIYYNIIFQIKIFLILFLFSYIALQSLIKADAMFFEKSPPVNKCTKLTCSS